jgi:hypothetical protein
LAVATSPQLARDEDEGRGDMCTRGWLIVGGLFAVGCGELEPNPDYEGHTYGEHAETSVDIVDDGTDVRVSALISANPLIGPKTDLDRVSFVVIAAGIRRPLVRTETNEWLAHVPEAVGTMDPIRVEVRRADGVPAAFEIALPGMKAARLPSRTLKMGGVVAVEVTPMQPVANTEFTSEIVFVGSEIPPTGPWCFDFRDGEEVDPPVATDVASAAVFHRFELRIAKPSGTAPRCEGRFGAFIELRKTFSDGQLRAERFRGERVTYIE